MDKIEYLSKTEEVSMGDEWFNITHKNHFWMRWRFEVFKKISKTVNLSDLKILEIGCGHGVVIEQLEEIDITNVDGCDLNINALKLVQNKKGRVLCYNVFDFEESLLNKYDVILLFDVIEHIEDPVEFLKACSKYLKKSGGTVYLNVPALSHLYSEYDKAVGHFRRYTRKKLRADLNSSSFINSKIFYWGMILYPIAIIRMLLMKLTSKEQVIKNGMKPPSKFINKVLLYILKFDTFIFKIYPFGTSIIASAEYYERKK